MKKALLILLLGAMAILIPGTLLKTIAPNIIAPNLLAVILVYLAFYEANAFGAFLAFCLGVELDLCSSLLLGPWAGAYVFVFGLLVLSSRRVFIESIPVVVIAVFLSSFLTTLVYHAFVAMVNNSMPFNWGVLIDAAIEAAFGAILAPPLIYLSRRKSSQKNRHLSY